MGRHFLRIAWVVGVVLTLLSACTSSEEERPAAPTPFTRLSDPTLTADSAFPSPEGDIILTVTGALGRTNAGDTAQFDLALLESLGMVMYTVDDYQATERVSSFEGILIADLLAYLQPQGVVVALEVSALNDYAITIPIADVEQYPVLLATRQDNSRMSVRNFGPTRIIYPYHLGGFDTALYDPRWIWSVENIHLVTEEATP